MKKYIFFFGFPACKMQNYLHKLEVGYEVISSSTTGRMKETHENGSNFVNRIAENGNSLLIRNLDPRNFACYCDLLFQHTHHH